MTTVSQDSGAESLVFVVQEGRMLDSAKVPNSPGVYEMLNAQQNVVYVGKANSLRKRLKTHFEGNGKSLKQRKMLSVVLSVYVNLVHSESEALLLENQLIKKHQPVFNVLLKDDKSYPELMVSMSHKHPGLYFHRGVHHKGLKYFGPFSSALAVKQNMQLLSKVFKVRTCQDAVYSYRTRPCLQYQTGFCSAPCVGRISDEEYRSDISGLLRFLSGDFDDLTQVLTARMTAYAEDCEFEKAARVRDQILQIRMIQKRHFVSDFEGDMDVIVVCQEQGFVLVRVFLVRQGQMFGHRDFNFSDQDDLGSFGREFLQRFYWKHELPEHLLFSESSWCAHQDAVQKIADFKDKVMPVLADMRDFFKQSLCAQWLTDVRLAFKKMLSSHVRFKEGLIELGQHLDIDYVPSRIECFDVSHFQGEYTVGACVVFEEGALRKSDYRLYKIRDVSAGDDYGAMKEMTYRRFKRVAGSFGPDILLVDGGLGQVNAVEEVLETLGLESILVLGISKGSARKVDEERIVCRRFKAHFKGITSPKMLRLLQYVRDEAHRFSISNSRKGVAQKREHARVIGVPGVGRKTTEGLIKHFGGLTQLKNATLVELSRVKGVGKKMSQKIYEYFRSEV